MRVKKATAQAEGISLEQKIGPQPMVTYLNGSLQMQWGSHLNW
jgi:hypothetical protein